MSDIVNRCRIVLVAPDISDPVIAGEIMGNALRGGDVASVILSQYAMDDSGFQKYLETLVPIVQKANVAAFVAGDSRAAVRVKADGLHIAEGMDVFEDAIGRFSPDMMVGGGRAKDRHSALQIGEMRPDYIFFGKLEGDIKDEAHPKNIALAEWWASLVEIPCVVMAGQAIESIVDVAESGAEFVALRLAVFAVPDQAPQMVAEANALLDEKAPRFGR